jgi:hypothetical protein
VAPPDRSKNTCDPAREAEASRFACRIRVRTKAHRAFPADSKSEVHNHTRSIRTARSALLPHETLPGHKPGKSEPPWSLAFALHPSGKFAALPHSLRSRLTYRPCLYLTSAISAIRKPPMPDRLNDVINRQLRRARSIRRHLRLTLIFSRKELSSWAAEQCKASKSV